MTGILADINIQGHIDLLMDLVRSDEWIEFWQFLDLTYVTFGEVGLRANASDADIWQLCQDQGYVLVTSNRNRDSADSLEATIRSRSTTDSLPVLTLSDPERMRNDRQYAGLVAISFIQTLLDIDAVRGAGRLYLP